MSSFIFLPVAELPISQDLPINDELPLQSPVTSAMEVPVTEELLK